MARWDYKINVKQHLSESEDRESIVSAYDGIKGELGKLPPGISRMVPDEFHDYSKMAVENEDVKIFNLGMDSLYDWADEYRVWMGL